MDRGAPLSINDAILEEGSDAGSAFAQSTGTSAGRDGTLQTEGASPSRTVTLAVENMVCGGCMRKVEQALLGVPGVASARANLSARRASVVFDEPQQSVAQLVDALGAVGFKAA